MIAGRGVLRMVGCTFPTPMRCLSFLAALLALPAVTRAQTAWDTTRWSVVCPDSSRIAVPAMCDDENPTAAAAFVRHQLETASPWLRGLGFYGPTVYKDGADPSFPYLAAIGGDQVIVDGASVCGFYDQRLPGGRLVVDAGHMITIGDAANLTGTGVHEMFHAVEGSYPFYATRTRQHGWIIEGMAQAVEAAYLNRMDSTPVFGPGGQPTLRLPRLLAPAHRA